MEKMEKFKQKLRVKVAWTTGALLLMTVTYIILMVNYRNLSRMPDFIQGFQAGIFLVLGLLLLGSLFKCLKAMTSETALKRRYVYETDERTILIAQKTGAAGMNICIAGLAFAAVTAGFFNEVVFYSLFGATAFTAFVKGFFKLHYHNKL
jgi:hypothetical protein